MPEVSPQTGFNPTGRKRSIPLILAAAVGVLVLVAGGAVAALLLVRGPDDDSTSATDSGSSAPQSPDQTTAAVNDTFDVIGTISLGGGCGSTKNGYYPDVSTGAQVTVLDSASEPVALGALSKGVDAPGGFGPCRFSFRIGSVPSDSDIYTLQIGTRDVQFTEAEASSLALSLGDD